jgi:hypothetical protein
MRRVLLFSFFLCLIFPSGFARESSSNALDVILNSTSVSERRTAYLNILENPSLYADQVLLRLEDWLKAYRQNINDPDKIVSLNRLIYLAAALKGNKFVGPLVKIATDSEYKEQQCIYCCPAIFALAVYSITKPWESPGQRTNWNIPDIPDVNSMLKDFALLPSSGHLEFPDPKGQQLLRRTETMSEEELIKQASPFDMDYTARWLAAEFLSWKVRSDRNLDELYWLALEDMDGTDIFYRCCIYYAILRAEKARAEKAK